MVSPPVQLSGARVRWGASFCRPAEWPPLGLGPGSGGGIRGPCRQALCSTSLALRRDTSGSPTGTFPSFSPPQGLGFWLARGPMWGQLCGPRQRGPAVCLLKEEKQHSDY